MAICVISSTLRMPSPSFTFSDRLKRHCSGKQISSLTRICISPASLRKTYCCLSYTKMHNRHKTKPVILCQKVIVEQFLPIPPSKPLILLASSCNIYLHILLRKPMCSDIYFHRTVEAKGAPLCKGHLYVK